VPDLLRQITDYGEPAWILVPAGGLFVLTAAVALVTRWRLMRTMLWQFCALYAFIFVGVGLPWLVTALLKRAIGRGRPELFETSGLLGLHPNWSEWTQQSFPSGHATTAFALAVVLGFLAPRWLWPALALAAAVGVSRVGLGVHYPSDVLAGAIVGGLGAYLVRWLFARRGWMFTTAPDGSIEGRAMSSLRRYLRLKRRGSA
jgi:membrane-associated phospholipid phosphatase